MKRLLQQKRGKPSSVHRNRNKSGKFFAPLSALLKEREPVVEKIFHVQGQRVAAMKVQGKLYRAICGARTNLKIFFEPLPKTKGLFFLNLSLFSVGLRICSIFNPITKELYCSSPGCFATIVDKNDSFSFIKFSLK